MREDSWSDFWGMLVNAGYKILMYPCQQSSNISNLIKTFQQTKCKESTKWKAKSPRLPIYLKRCDQQNFIYKSKAVCLRQLKNRRNSCSSSPEYLLQKDVISAFEKSPNIFEGASEEYVELRGEETSLFLAKSQRNWRHTTPNFTEEEQLEREFMVEVLGGYIIYVKYCGRRWRCP